MNKNKVPKPLLSGEQWPVHSGVQLEFLDQPWTYSAVKKMTEGPWLVWLSGSSAGLQTKGLPVLFPVRAHAWVTSQVPSRGGCERQPHIDVSLPLFLPPFPSI